jgi:hypothetical protein
VSDVLLQAVSIPSVHVVHVKHFRSLVYWFREASKFGGKPHWPIPHVVNEAQILFEVAVAATEMYSIKVQLVSAVQPRLLVVVGAIASYSVDEHVVLGVHMALTSALKLSPATQALQARSEDAVGAAVTPKPAAQFCTDVH